MRRCDVILCTTSTNIESDNKEKSLNYLNNLRVLILYFKASLKIIGTFIILKLPIFFVTSELMHGMDVTLKEG